MWRIIGAAIVALGIYIYTQNDGDPQGIGLWFSIGAFAFLLWIWRKKPKNSVLGVE